MSNNNNNNNNDTNNSNNRVSGPTSALTSFLREHGIRVPNTGRRARREAQRNNEIPQEQEEQQPESSAAPTARTSMLYRPSERKTKDSKKRKKNDGSDESDSDSSFDPNDFRPSSSGPRKLPTGRARIAFCDQCKGRFVRKTENENIITCPKCLAGETPSKKPSLSRKRTIPAVQKKKIYCEHQIPSLQEICVSVVAEHIDEIDTFGIISDESFEKLGKIISRNRKLTDQIAKLFMEPDRKILSLGDCSKMTDHGLYMISQFCIRMERLSLIYCGHITDRTLLAYCDRLHHFKSLELSGPFLVTKEAWIKFFETMGPRLEGFSLANTARFLQECVDALVMYCPNVKKLKLKQLSHMSTNWLASLAKLKKLESLELAWPTHEYKFDTKDMVHLLSKVGPHLKELSVKGGHHLTNEILSEGILKHCQNLQKLSLEQCGQLTAEAMVEFLDNWKARGLVELNVARCTSFNDDVLKAIVRHSGQSLKRLNLHSLQLLTASGLELLAGNGSDLKPCRFLTHLNCGFVRSMDDFVLKRLIDQCESLENAQVFGCNLLTDSVKLRDGLLVAGREF
ncbi:uncharacterized protein B0P05DRAFT_194533 [Gilbertella persicaria]|uniref:uncharacterized protein n=1 Tax=Gilbertella persicaria TaxID=101096 RepID=UPI002220AEF1|nr:uncharacterized protein B0P05DRAFT_194533 [Gilbertella persicaria]KAI8069073.1 hypothetical protein B0P05DRAFT_194533 [Gilbertella persicaria]